MQKRIADVILENLKCPKCGEVLALSEGEKVLSARQAEERDTASISQVTDTLILLLPTTRAEIPRRP